MDFLVYLITFLVGLITLCLYPYWKFRKLRKALINLPGPPLHNYFVGNLPDIPKNPRDQVKDGLEKIEIYKEYGMLRFFFGPFPVLNIFNPKLIREVINSSKHSEKNFLYDPFLPWLNGGLLVSSGNKWKTRRRLITPAFHFEVLHRFLDVMNEQAIIMIEKLKEKRDQEFDIFGPITACALDIICETAMGRQVFAQQTDIENQYVKGVYDMSRSIVERVENPWLLNDFIYSISSQGKRQKETLKTLHGFTLTTIRERKKLLESQKNLNQENIKLAFLDILLNAQDEDGNFLSEDDVREEVDTFMFEGHDTTSASMAWTISLIGQYPEVQKRLQDEVDQVIGDSQEITFDSLSQLKYLEMVIKESLRLYPSVPMMGRILTEDVLMNDHIVPKGTAVNISIFSLHHNPLVWENPSEFNPERWTLENCEGRDPFSYIPFSAGPRNCIGQKFAMNEEKVILSKIIQNFTITSRDKDPTIIPEIILRPLDGLFVKLEERKNKM